MSGKISVYKWNISWKWQVKRTEFIGSSAEIIKLIVKISKYKQKLSDRSKININIIGFCKKALWKNLKHFLRCVFTKCCNFCLLLHLLWNGAIAITKWNSNSNRVCKKTFFKENENKLANHFYFEKIWKNREIQEHVFPWMRDSRVAKFIYLKTFYITHLGGDWFCYITFSLLRRPHQQNVTLDLDYVFGYFQRKHCESLVKTVSGSPIQ